MHQDNLLARRSYDRFADYRRRVAINRLFRYLGMKLGIGGRMDDFAHREFRTIETPDRRTYMAYRRIVRMSRNTLTRKAGMLLSMMAYYRFGSRRG